MFKGIDDFLDNVTVLPPGEWDPKTRIEPPKSVPNKVKIYIQCLFKKISVYEI